MNANLPILFILGQHVSELHVSFYFFHFAPARFLRAILLGVASGAVAHGIIVSCKINLIL